MPKRSAKTQRDFKHTWYLQEWMQQAGKIQADLQKELGWSRGKAHDVWHGQQYTQDIIDAVAPWPFAPPQSKVLTTDSPLLGGCRVGNIGPASDIVVCTSR